MRWFIVFIIIVIVGFSQGCMGFRYKDSVEHPIDLTQIKRLIIYDYDYLRSENPPYEKANTTTLKKIPHYEVDSKTIAEIMSHVKYYPVGIISKGSSLGIAILKDATEIHLIFGHIDPCQFFGVERKGHYVIEGDVGEKWREIFFEKIIEETFVPARPDLPSRKWTLSDGLF